MNLSAALRASPDHLAFRAESVIASKDSVKIVDFVRDSLAVVPPWGDAGDYTAIRWGRAAALVGLNEKLTGRKALMDHFFLTFEFPLGTHNGSVPGIIEPLIVRAAF